MRVASPSDVSIIIVAPRMSGYLAQGLAAIRALVRPPRETIVVLDEAPPTSVQAARCIVTGTLGPARKRDIAAAKAEGEFLAFLDDDAYPDPGWLEAAVPHFDRPDVWAVGGPGVTPPDDGFRAQVSGWTYAAWIVSGPARFRYVQSGNRIVDDYPSMNLIVRRSAFQAIGGFDSAFYPGEDTKLCLEIVRRGGIIQYEAKALVFHHRRPVMRGHLAQIAHYGRHRGYFARVFPATSRRIQYFVPSLWIIWLVGAAAGSIWLEPARVALLVSLSVYAAALVISAVSSIFQSGSFRVGLAVVPTIVASHLLYGWHFLGGLIRPKP